MKKIYYIFSYIVFLSTFLFNTTIAQQEKNRTHKITTSNHYKYIAINEILMWVSNNGDGSHNPRTGGNGFYWPGGEQAMKSAIFEDGLVYGGKVNGQIRVNGNTHRQGLQAGKILSPGVADDSSLTKYRVYRIRKDWQSYPAGPEKESLKKDYEEWPVEDGAPWVDVNEDGIFTRGTDKPRFEGDEVLWYVANDLDTARTRHTYGSPPLGLEFQTTIYGFFVDSSYLLGNVVFKKYKVINKNDTAVTDMYFTYWNDVDLGDPRDDFTGFDTSLQMGYTYNSDNEDGGGMGNTYGIAPPAVGHLIIQAPVIQSFVSDSAFFNGIWQKGFRNLRMNATGMIMKLSTTLPTDPYQGDYLGTLQWYYLMQGLNNSGDPIVDPNTGLATKYPLSGDPVNQTGWYEGSGWPNGPPPRDQRMHVPVGPFNIAPGDTQEVVIAILISKGTDNINSITTLKRDASILRNTYTEGFKFNNVINAPEIKTYAEENKIVLWWDAESESFNELDKSLIQRGLSDTTYTFEGYKIWQYSDSLGSNPTLIKIFDIENDVQRVKDYVLINGIREYVTVLNSPNSGIRHYIELTQDEINKTKFYDGTPYYFGLSAFAYSPNSFKKIIESESQIISVVPGRNPIDVTYSYLAGDTIHLEQTRGMSNVNAKLAVVDPSALTGDTYEVVMGDSAQQYSYTFYNKTKNDTLLKNSKDYSQTADDKTIFDGMILFVDIDKAVFNTSEKIKNVIEVKGPGGIVISKQKSVFEELNSTGDWKIGSYSFSGVVGDIRSLNYRNQMTVDDFEIRFNSTGSEYYTTGYTAANPTLSNNPKGKNRVPFEVWRIKRDGSADERLYIKTMDNDISTRDTSWSYNAVLNRWESIYAYTSVEPYSEPIPVMSGNSTPGQHLLGHVSIIGELPAEGTVIRINTYKPPVTGDLFSAVATAPTRNNYENAKQNIDKITIFPNPYFGSSSLEAGGTERIVRMTNLPNNVIVRIYSLAGVFIKRIDKENQSPWLDWDLRNEDGSLVGSGVYLLYLDLPGIGTKIMKLAVVQSN